MSFTPDELKSFIEKELNDSNMIPPGHKGAFVTYLDQSGVRTAIAWKADDGWQVTGTIGYHPQEDGLDVGLNLMRSW